MNISEYKRKLNEEIYNYFFSNPINKIAFNSLYIQVKKMLDNDGQKWANPNEFSKEKDNLLALKKELESELKNPRAEAIDFEELRNDYIKPLFKIASNCKIESGLPLTMGNVALEIMEIETLLRSKYEIATQKKISSNDYVDWNAELGEENEYMENADFMCLYCGDANLKYYKEGLHNVESHQELKKSDHYWLQKETIFFGYIIMNFIHYAIENKKLTGNELINYVQENIISWILSDVYNYLSEGPVPYTYIYKWVKGWDDVETNISDLKGIGQFENWNQIDYGDTHKHNINELVTHYISQYNKWHSYNRFIKELYVKDLFGYNSFRLNFNTHNNENGNISIVVGPNGLGKTTLMNMLKAVLIQPVPRHYYVGISEEMRKAISIAYKDPILDLFEIPFKEFCVIFNDNAHIKVNKEMLDKYVVLNFEVQCDGINKTQDISLEYSNDLELNLNSLNESELQKLYQIIDDLFPSMNKEKRFIFINANRLYNTEWRDIFTYSLASKEIKKGYESESDRNNEKWKDAEYWFSSLLTVELNHQYIYGKHDKTFKNKFERLSELFNDFYYSEDPSGKTLTINDNHVCLKNKQGKFLEIDCLSTGEANILQILYQLIFNVDNKGVVLIDEPEISLHLAWQKKLAETIFDIVEENKGMQVIIASHSPFLTAGHSDCMIGADYE